jgi:ATP-binding cassette, subfamily B, bacterial HlyB/CyaB
MILDQIPSAGADQALVMLLAFHSVSFDPTLSFQSISSRDTISVAEIVRVANRVPEIRARHVRATLPKLAKLPLPALACGANGWFVLAAIRDDAVLVQFPGSPPARISQPELEAMWSGDLILITRRAGAGAGASRFGLGWFVPQIVKYRRLIGEVLAVTFVINLLGLAAPLFFQNIVDKVLVHNTATTLSVLAIGFAIVSVWEVVFGWLRTRLYSETCQKIDVQLGARLYRHMLALPLGYFENRRVGDTVMRVRQLENIREFLTNASLTVLIDPLFTVVFLVAMWIYSPLLLGIVALSLVGYVVVSLALTKPLRARLNEKFDRGSINNALLVESVSGIQTVKASAVEPQWQSRWEEQLAGYSVANQSVINLGNSGSQAVQLVSKLSLVAILYFGAREVMVGALTVGGLVAFNMFAQRVSGPVIRMAELWQQFQQVRISIDRLGDVLNVPTEPGAGSATALPAMRGAIRFEDVRFRYALDGPWTIDGVSLDLVPGQTLGIVGSSGSGKSTLTKLIQRLYTPASGRILIDGVDVAQIDPAWLRRQIGVVLQENLLFSRTVRENIALANPALPIEHVMAAAQLAGAHEFILSLPQGYDTVVEERGVNFSGGQRQRVAIARALVTQPRILILDEATSALDAESEEIIQTNLKAMARGRTVIIIAHRLSAIRQCGTIMAMERGRVIEQGSHEELLAARGRYADLYRRQMGWAEAAA